MFLDQHKSLVCVILRIVYNQDEDNVLIQCILLFQAHEILS